MEKRLVIDPGHGGRDPGAVQLMVEKDINLKISNLLANKLITSTDVKLMLTRNSDKYVSLDRRCIIANDFSADLFLSLHSNAGGGAGYEDYIFSGSVPKETVRSRDILHDFISGVWLYAGRPNRGKKTAGFRVLQGTKMTAILIENGFLDNREDVALLKDDDFLERLIEGMFQGIQRILNLSNIKTGLWKNQTGAFKEKNNAVTQAAALTSAGFPVYTFYDPA